MNQRLASALVAALVCFVCAGCTSTALHLEKRSDSPVTGSAFVGDEVVEYEAWEIMTIRPPFLGIVASGLVLATIDPDLDRLRNAMPSGELREGDHVTSHFNPYEHQDLKSWNELGHKGWLVWGSGMWSHCLLPHFYRTNTWHDPAYKYQSQESRRVEHVDLIEEATGTKDQKRIMVLVSIVPPVVAVLDDGCRTRFIERSMYALPIHCWKPDEDADCLISGLWSLTRVPGERRIKGTRLIPEGTTMTLGEVREKGPSLWREELEAMREFVEPKPLKPR